MNILITGANSYLGANLKDYLESLEGFFVDVLDMLDPDWAKTDFTKYDVVVNVCAIVHRPEVKDINLYENVNHELAVSIALKAKSSLVKQFIQISTNGVFGLEIGEMAEKFGYNPKTPYEKSKFEADLDIEKLRSENFKVCIVRPPLIYGKGCKGNYPTMEKFAKKSPIFPKYRNKRDFIYIKNLTNFIGFAIINKLNEICYPRDMAPICVYEMVKMIAISNNKKIWLIHILNPFVWLGMKINRKFRLVFGDNYCTERIESSGKWCASYDFASAAEEMYGNKQ